GKNKNKNTVDEKTISQQPFTNASLLYPKRILFIIYYNSDTFNLSKAFTFELFLFLYHLY
ncbi:MAG: hypothetical protein IKK97_05700, partial [Phascolarctobacterium sp.]|nr:hypothetical protein [Phascolarctobacterium sp.]